MKAMRKFAVGDKIKFAEEKLRYTVHAASDRYLVCTKPFAARKTVIYTLVDLEEGRRATVGYIFSPYDFAKREDCERCLADLESGESKLSRRNNVALVIEGLAPLEGP